MRLKNRHAQHVCPCTDFTPRRCASCVCRVRLRLAWSRKDWDTAEETAKGMIKLNVLDWPSENIDLNDAALVTPLNLTGRRSAHLLWTDLVRNHQRSDTVAIMNAEEHLRALRYIPGTSITDHFKELHRHAGSLQNMNAMLSKERLSTIMVRSLSPTWKPLFAALLGSSDPVSVKNAISRTPRSSRLIKEGLLIPFTPGKQSRPEHPRS